MATSSKAAITSDLGGESELSEIERILVEQAALASVVVKDAYTRWLGGEPIPDDERRIFEKYTGRTTPPGKRVSEMMCVIGRRGGKSKAISALACYYAALCEHQLSRGECGVVLLIAQDRRARQGISRLHRGVL
jgi:hypothetical protein